MKKYLLSESFGAEGTVDIGRFQSSPHDFSVRFADRAPATDTRSSTHSPDRCLQSALNLGSDVGTQFSNDGFNQSLAEVLKRNNLK